MNVLIIGFGKMGMMHAAIVNSVCKKSHITISEPNPLIRRFLGKTFPHFRIVKDLSRLRLSDIDIAIICSPSDYHCETLTKLIPYGINILVEKPIVSSLSELNKVLSQLKEYESNHVLMVGNCFRFSDSFNLAKKIIDKIPGKINHFVSEFYSSDVLKPNKGWRYSNRIIGKGVILDLGIHVIDMSRHLFGMPQISDSRLVSVYSDGNDDELYSKWNYESFFGEIYCSWSKPDIRKPSLSIKVFYDDSILIIDEDKVALTNKDGKLIENFYSSHDKNTVIYDLAGPMYTNQFSEFYRAIIDKATYRNGIDEAKENHNIIDRIIKLSNQ